MSSTLSHATTQTSRTRLSPAGSSLSVGKELPYRAFIPCFSTENITHLHKFKPKSESYGNCVTILFCVDLFQFLQERKPGLNVFVSYLKFHRFEAHWKSRHVLDTWIFIVMSRPLRFYFSRLIILEFYSQLNNTNIVIIVGFNAVKAFFKR